jgi:hypothetical protein
VQDLHLPRIAEGGQVEPAASFEQEIAQPVEGRALSGRQRQPVTGRNCRPAVCFVVRFVVSYNQGVSLY